MKKKIILLIFSEKKQNYSLSGPYLHEHNRRKNKMIARSAKKKYLICREGKKINSSDVKTLPPPWVLNGRPPDFLWSHLAMNYFF